MDREDRRGKLVVAGCLAKWGWRPFIWLSSSENIPGGWETSIDFDTYFLPNRSIIHSSKKPTVGCSWRASIRATTSHLPRKRHLSLLNQSEETGVGLQNLHHCRSYDSKSWIVDSEVVKEEKIGWLPKWWNSSCHTSQRIINIFPIYKATERDIPIDRSVLSGTPFFQNHQVSLALGVGKTVVHLIRICHSARINPELCQSTDQSQHQLFSMAD